MVKIENKSTDISEVYIYGPIGDYPDDNAVRVQPFAEQMKSIKGSLTRFYVNSPGGFVTDAIAMHSIIRRMPGMKEMIVDGLAASAASVLIMAGDTVKMSSGGFIMIHEPWAMVVGTASDMVKTAESLNKSREVIVNMYLSKVGEAYRKRIESDLTKETWYNADEALALGLVDDIIKDRKAQNAVGLEKFGYKNNPFDSGTQSKYDVSSEIDRLAKRWLAKSE